MTNEERRNILAEAMDIDVNNLKDDAILSSFDEWDSLAALSLMSLFSSKLNKKVTPEDIKALNTVLDVLKLME